MWPYWSASSTAPSAASARRSGSWPSAPDEHEVSEARTWWTPIPAESKRLEAGEVGVVIAGIKSLDDVRIGDTLTDATRPPSAGAARLPRGEADGVQRALPGTSKPRTTSNLKLAPLEKLRLNDASFTYEPETSAALGFGFRCGFLGFLHGEIIQERLEREYELD